MIRVFVCSLYDELDWPVILEDPRIVALKRRHTLTDGGVAAILNSVNVAIVQVMPWKHSPESLVLNDPDAMRAVLVKLEFAAQVLEFDENKRLGLSPYLRGTHTERTAVYFAYPRTPVSLLADLTCCAPCSGCKEGHPCRGHCPSGQVPRISWREEGRRHPENSRLDATRCTTNFSLLFDFDTSLMMRR